MVTFATTSPERTSPARAAAEGRSALSGLAIPLLLVGVLIVLILGLVSQWLSKRQAVAFDSSYQAVLLTNGSVYFGRLQGYGTTDPELTDAFYVITHADPNTKQVTNVVVK